MSAVVFEELRRDVLFHVRTAQSALHSLRFGVSSNSADKDRYAELVERQLRAIEGLVARHVCRVELGTAEEK